MELIPLQRNLYDFPPVFTEFDNISMMQKMLPHPEMFLENIK